MSAELPRLITKEEQPVFPCELLRTDGGWQFWPENPLDYVYLNSRYSHWRPAPQPTASAVIPSSPSPVHPFAESREELAALAKQVSQERGEPQPPIDYQNTQVANREPSPVQGETPTPRTDAEERTSERYDGEEIPGFDYVSSDFSRTLERELAEAKEWVEYYKLNAASWRNSYDDRRAREEKAFADLQSAQSSLALAQARAGEAEKQLTVERGERDRDYCRVLKERDSLLAVRDKEFWSWQGDGTDHLESLTCPILIQAADLKAALRSQAAPSGRPAQPAPVYSEEWMKLTPEDKPVEGYYWWRDREGEGEHVRFIHNDERGVRVGGPFWNPTQRDLHGQWQGPIKRHQPAREVGEGLDGKRLDWLLCTEGSLPAMEKAWLKIEPPTGNTPYGDPKIKGRAAIDAAMEGKR